MAPQEICDYILDFLGNPSDIRAWSLVDYSFFTASRRRQFRSITVKETTVDGLLNLVKSPRCTFPPFVQRFEISMIGNLSVWLGKAVECFDLLALTNLTLILFKFYDRSYPRLQEKQPGLFSKLTSLHLMNSQFVSLNYLFGIVRSAPLLEEVSFDGIKLEENAPPSILPTIPPALRTLIVTGAGDTQGDIIGALLQVPNFPPLKEVKFPGISPRHFTIAGQFLRKLGSSLEKLTIGLSGSCVETADQCKSCPSCLPSGLILRCSPSVSCGLFRFDCAYESHFRMHHHDGRDRLPCPSSTRGARSHFAATDSIPPS